MYVNRYDGAAGYVRAVLHVDWPDGRGLRIETTRPALETYEETSRAVGALVGEWLRGVLERDLKGTTDPDAPDGKPEQ